MPFRSIRRVLPAARVVEPDGTVLVRPLPSDVVPFIDPVLQLDSIGPVDLDPARPPAPRAAALAGVECVYLVLAGQHLWRDSTGARHELGPGDAVWATGGSGLVREVGPTPAMAARGGVVHTVELWLNLPRAKKGLAPSSTLVRAGDIQSHSNGLGTIGIRLLAGVLGQLRAPARGAVPLHLLQVSLAPGAIFTHPADPRWNAAVFLVDGVAGFAQSKVARHGQLAWFERDGDQLRVENPANAAAALELLVAVGPIGDEPLVRAGGLAVASDGELRALQTAVAEGRFPSLPPG